MSGRAPRHVGSGRRPFGDSAGLMNNPNCKAEPRPLQFLRRAAHNDDPGRWSQKMNARQLQRMNKHGLELRWYTHAAADRREEPNNIKGLSDSRGQSCQRPAHDPPKAHVNLRSSTAKPRPGAIGRPAALDRPVAHAWPRRSSDARAGEPSNQRAAQAPPRRARWPPSPTNSQNAPSNQ